MLEDLLDALRETDIPFEAYAWEVAPKSDYGVVSMDSGGDHQRSDNRVIQHTVEGTVDLYAHGKSTKSMLAVEHKLNELTWLSWALNSVQYETETRLVHYEWTYSMVVTL